MFTGIIKHKGVLGAFRSGRPSRLSVDCAGICGEAELGDSVAVNGCCLTVAQLSPPRIVFDVSDETRRTTTLESLSAGAALNLETALRAGDPVGGHFVTGHVDGVATFAGRSQEDVFVFDAPAEIIAGLVLKGAVAVDGVSLTVSALTVRRFEAAVIPTTLEWTNLAALSPGTRVNVETDLLGKYVYRALGEGGPRQDLTLDFLKKHGFA